jgi:hypothetical protein
MLTEGLVNTVSNLENESNEQDSNFSGTHPSLPLAHGKNMANQSRLLSFPLGRRRKNTNIVQKGNWNMLNPDLEGRKLPFSTCSSFPFLEYCGQRIKYYLLRYHSNCLEVFRLENMFRKKTTIGQSNQEERANSREKMDVTLRKLQALKDKISEIRHQCEELRKQVSANKVFENKVFENKVSENKVSENKASLCNQCGNAIEPNQEVVVKDSAGIERRHYHTKCFQALFK